MTDTLQPSITLGDAAEIELEEAERISLGEAQGDAYGNWNGFTFKRHKAIDRSGYSSSSSAITRFTNSNQAVSRT